MIAATQSNHPIPGVVPAVNVQSALEQACSRMHNVRMRVTKPRVAIFETLLKCQGPISIDQIHQALGKKPCDLVTIYRCLAAFERVGLVRRSFSHQGTSLWEVALNSPRHYHIVCKSCGRTEQADYFPVDEMERVLRNRGYTEVSHMVESFGVCPQCQQAAGSRAMGPGVSDRTLT
ncbi:MAG: transcriptional repressor [Opitutaceae bacterium]|nr:transcriptional repressor [Opitutaceae bacterium]